MVIQLDSVLCVCSVLGVAAIGGVGQKKCRTKVPRKD